MSYGARLIILFPSKKTDIGDRFSSKPEKNKTRRKRKETADLSVIVICLFGWIGMRGRWSLVAL